jgi:hypothetical protein
MPATWVEKVHGVPHAPMGDPRPPKAKASARKAAQARTLRAALARYETCMHAADVAYSHERATDGRRWEADALAALHEYPTIQRALRAQEG